MARRATGLWVYKRADGGEPSPPPPPIYVAPPSLSPVFYVIYVARQDGVIIGELAGQLESVAWATDGYGMAPLVMPLGAALRSGALLEFGGRVGIEFSNGLAPWGGVVDVPRETSLGVARSQFYEAVYMLNWLLTGPNDLYIGSEAAPAADILVDLVARAGLDVTIDATAAVGGEPVEVEFHYETLAQAADKLRGMDAHLHYFIRPRLSAGRIDFELVLFREMRADDSDRAVLIQGHNLVGWTALEQGPIYNEVLAGVGDFLNETPAEDGTYRELYVATDGASRQRYGRRQQLLVLPEVEGESGPGRAAARARAQLATYGKPRLRVQGACLNLSPGLYRNFSIGSRVRVESSIPMALNEQLTVIGMDFQPAAGTLSLVFDDNSGIGG